MHILSKVIPYSSKWHKSNDMNDSTSQCLQNDVYLILVGSTNQFN